MNHRILSPLLVPLLVALLVVGCTRRDEVKSAAPTPAAAPVTETASKAAPAPALVVENLDLAAWQQDHPAQYQGWAATAEPTPVGKSKYKRGFDTDGIIYDKIDEYPYLAVLLNGIGYGFEFTEPRGHANMIKDQLHVDPARVKAGGSCLSCKTPYAPALYGTLGEDYFRQSFHDVLGQIPESDQLLGVACVDCHQSSADPSLRLARDFTLGRGLKALGKDQSSLMTQELRSLVCAQCHVTYSMTKDAEMKTTDVVFPWQGSGWGNIGIEQIIAQLRSAPAYAEWTQSVTGFKLGIVRHAEFEVFSKGSPHWEAGVACADCHMPAEERDGRTVSDHRIMSPLKNDLKACTQCHEESPEELRGKVFAIQDEAASRLIRAGYATARVAKLFELANNGAAAGKAIDEALYAQARAAYEDALYRVLYIQNENSTGFHNPEEVLRILKDAKTFHEQADSLLRRAMAQAGIEAPAVVDLELDKYLNHRGEKKIMHRPEWVIADPLPERRD